MTGPKAKWVETPNSRLIYKTLWPKDGPQELLSNSINALVQLEQLVMEQTRFQWANTLVYFYFFERPTSLEFEQTPVWVGREVIGPPNEDSSGRFGLHDLARGTCLQGPVRPGLFDLELLQLKESYVMLRDKFRDEGVGPEAKTWRMAFEGEGVSMKGQIQLFPE